MTRSLFFTIDSTGSLGPATAMEHAIIEVLSVPDEYTDEAAAMITESVHRAGIIETRARTGSRGGPVRITWAALIEKGIAAGILEQIDA